MAVVRDEAVDVVVVTHAQPRRQQRNLTPKWPTIGRVEPLQPARRELLQLEVLKLLRMAMPLWMTTSWYVDASHIA